MLQLVFGALLVVSLIGLVNFIATVNIAEDVKTLMKRRDLQRLDDMCRLIQSIQKNKKRRMLR